MECVCATWTCTLRPRSAGRQKGAMSRPGAAATLASVWAASCLKMSGGAAGRGELGSMGI